MIGRGDPEELRHYATRVASGARKMDNLLNDLLLYSSTGRGEVTLGPINLEELVSNIIAEHEADIKAAHGWLKH